MMLLYQMTVYRQNTDIEKYVYAIRAILASLDNFWHFHNLRTASSFNTFIEWYLQTVLKDIYNFRGITSCSVLYCKMVWCLYI